MKKISPSSLTSKLASYSAAASMVAFGAAKTEAQIIYTDVNPDYAYLDEWTGSEHALIDLNNDGIFDFRMVIYEYYLDFASTWETISWISGLNNNRIAHQSIVVATSSSASTFSIGIFMQGDTIDADKNWESSANLWLDSAYKYFGLQLNVDGVMHYGWLRLSWESVNGLLVADYAYNTAPDQLILAGDSGCIQPVNSPVISQEGQTLIADLQNGNQWYHNGAIIPGETNPSFTPAEFGSYSVLNTDPQGCLASSPPYQFLDCSNLAVDVSSNPVDNAGNICLPFSYYYGDYEQYRLTSNAPYGYYSIWNVDGYSYDFPRYYVENWQLEEAQNVFYVVITNGVGCADTSRIFHSYVDPNCPDFAPQNDPVGVEAYYFLSHDEFNFVIKDGQIRSGTAQFYNSIGQLIAEKSYTNSFVSFSVRSLPPGIYFGVFQNGDQRRTLEFFVGTKE